MISAIDYLTYDFKNYYIIRPSIKFEKKLIMQEIIREKGKKVKENFEYTSDKNFEFKH